MEVGGEISRRGLLSLALPLLPAWNVGVIIDFQQPFCDLKDGSHALRMKE